MNQTKVYRIFLIVFLAAIAIYGILTFGISHKLGIPIGYVLCGGSACNIGASLTVVNPEEQSTETGGGGGGGSTRAVPKAPDIEIDKDNVEVKPIQGEIKKETITITNPGNKELEIKLDAKDIAEFVSLSEDEFILKPGEKKSIIIEFSVDENEDLVIYKGNLSIIVNNILAEYIPLEIMILPKERIFFDIIIEIPDKYKDIKVGDELLATVRLFRMKDLGLIDANIKYIIKDIENNILLTEEETLLVETQTSFVKEFKIPEDFETGDYNLFIEVSYGNMTIGTSSTSFKVTKKEGIEQPNIVNINLTKKEVYWIYVFIGIISLSILILSIEVVKLRHRRKKNKKRRKLIKKMTKKDLKNKGLIITEDREEKKDNKDNYKVIPYFK